jgi:hypothetical protein
LDRRRALRRLGAALGACALTAAAGPASPPALRDLIWTDPSAERALALTHHPSGCLARRDEAVEAGRALFMSRTLLGGPAARIGLSCASCHVNGRDNPHFLLLELTDRAGFADVTSGWSSTVRDDGVANPVRIPDLADVASRASFGAQREPSLEAFVESVIVDEFQGAPPSPRVRAALLAYLGAIRTEACGDAEAVTMAALADDARRAFAAAGASDDAALRDLLLLATQDALARIVERLPARAFARERAGLELIARETGALRGVAFDAATMTAWRARFDALARRLERRERRTYANARTLARALTSPR